MVLWVNFSAETVLAVSMLSEPAVWYAQQKEMVLFFLCEYIPVISWIKTVGLRGWDVNLDQHPRQQYAWVIKTFLCQFWGVGQENGIRCTSFRNLTRSDSLKLVDN